MYYLRVRLEQENACDVLHALRRLNWLPMKRHMLVRHLFLVVEIFFDEDAAQDRELNSKHIRAPPKD